MVATGRTLPRTLQRGSARDRFSDVIEASVLLLLSDVDLATTFLPDFDAKRFQELETASLI